MGTNRILRFNMETRGDTIAQEPLTDLGGLYVWVSQIDPEIEQLGLSRVLLVQEVERRVLAAGIPLLGNRELLAAPLFPCLGVLVNIDRSQFTPPHYLYSVEVFFVKSGKLLGQQNVNSLQMLWSREATGDVRQYQREIDWSNVFSSMTALVDRFINDYLTANQKPAGPALLN